MGNEQIGNGEAQSPARLLPGHGDAAQGQAFEGQRGVDYEGAIEQSRPQLYCQTSTRQAWTASIDRTPNTPMA